MGNRGSRWVVLAVVVVLPLVAGCGGSGSGAEEPADTSVSVTPDNIVVIDSARIESGPSLTGSLQPQRVANVRAEVAGAILSVSAERGESVGRGEVLARIDDSGLRDDYLSARSAVSTAEQAATVARRNAERAARLAEAGAIAERDLETARLEQETAEAQLADAQARLANAQKQLDNTRVRAPFTGIVSERPANAGDVVQPGAALFTVVDPSSMRLEAAVPAKELASLRVGAPVEFRVTGYPDRVFAGTIDRISPTVDPATGMVTTYVSIPNDAGALVGGLFADGRVGAQSRETLVAPADAVDRSGGNTTVMRIRQGRAERVPVEIGLRDEQNELVEIVSGIAPGDTLLLGTAQGITAGTPVRVQELEDRPTAQR